MKLSVFTTITYPEERGDAWLEALTCYKTLADELVVVNGSYDEIMRSKDPSNVVVHNPWPKEFSWEFIGQQFQRGYEAATGDWVIHADLDFIFHENDYEAIRRACQQHSDAPALSFWKHQFVLPDRFNLKSRLVVAVNKGKYGDRIRFDSGGDLCQPSLDGAELKPDHVPEARIVLWNYEKLLKTEAQIKDDVGRMARAWQKHWGEWRLGGPDDDSAYNEWLKMQIGRFKKPQEHISLGAHPKVMQSIIRELSPDQWGYSGFSNLGVNDYLR
jgi:hypothetical protein